MNHCCLIGGGGFIGTHVANVLLAQGRKVTVLDTRPAPIHLSNTAEYVVGDYGHEETLRRALANVDTVINLSYASVPSTSIEDPIRDILCNLPAAVRLFETVSDYAIQKIVVSSSGGTVYGPAQGLPLTENHATNPISPYGVTKLAIEKYGHMFYRLKELPVVVVRPANAFGERQNPFVGQGFIATAIAAILSRRGIILYGPHGTIRDYVHVEDVASGIVAALEYGQPGAVYNIGSGQGRSNKDVLDEIRPYAESLGLALQIETLPARRFDVDINVLDSTKLHDDTGWNIRITFTEGIKRTWDWFVRNKNLWLE
ncbi:MAG: NAD-dependent epimerase/dehydratase family protein [Nitrospiraceae bacterium]|nr:MAG: NAD-dependent epimerase/dehydratase family protein [Nitrospiraceae bacterium]